MYDYKQEIAEIKSWIASNGVDPREQLSELSGGVQYEKRLSYKELRRLTQAERAEYARRRNRKKT